MENLLPYLGWLSGRESAMVERIHRWCRIRTGSLDAEALRRFSLLLVEEFSALAAPCESLPASPWKTWDDQGQPAEKVLGPVLVWRKRPEAPRQVLLAIHTDVVYAESEKDEESLRVFREGDWLHAPGSVDAKGGIAMVREALLCLEASPWAENLGWRVVLNPDEEIGSPGSAEILLREARGCEFALLFEPALPDGSLVGERKGSGNFMLAMRGRAAHAGRDPEKGRNAIHALAETLIRITALHDGKDGLTVNVGRISGGGSANRVADQALAMVNFRVRDGIQQKEVLRRLAEEEELWSRREGFALRVQGGFTAPPKANTGATASLMKRVLACGTALGLDIQVKKSGGVCDGNRLAAAGLPNVDTLGPIGEGLHGAGEKLYLPSLMERTQLASLILLAAASGSWPGLSQEKAEAG